MKTHRAALLTVLATLALAACEKGKPRHVPFDPMAVMPPPPESVVPIDGLSAGLTKREDLASFSIDRIGSALFPADHQPAVTSGAAPILIQGFGLDPVTLQPGKGVDLLIDDKVYGTLYGADRPDVGRFYKKPDLVAVGFKTTIPAGALAIGPHLAQVRVVASDGKAYFDGHKIAFQVK